MTTLDDNWDLTNLEASSAARAIRVIHLCCLRYDLNKGDEAYMPPAHHWVLCLETSSADGSGAASSVMLDMAPGYGSDGLRGKIKVSSLKERYTDKTLRAFSSVVPEPGQRDAAAAGGTSATTTTVADLMDLIQKNGRQAYDFLVKFDGWRHWLWVVMGDLEEAGWIPGGSAGVAIGWLPEFWLDPEGSDRARIMHRGVFRS
ncbi:hypothetical protein F4778DRAFT_728094 [Xylariomycetidae sp. FL2044]|nr:hypothetical protein F4778DRAFT_728094 [Xylariomycetidae sp. FL2044]